MCNVGHNCTYYHRLPEFEDSLSLEHMQDCFGRARHAQHRDDMGGVGAFTSDCDTLFVGDLRFDRKDADPLRKLEQDLWEGFGAYGEVESIRVIPTKALAFIRFAHRAAAEFAKLAMSDQGLGESKMISVRWAKDDPNPNAKKHRTADVQDIVEAQAEFRIKELGLSKSDLAGMMLGDQPASHIGVTAPYPDTSAQYPSRAAPGPCTRSAHDFREGLTHASTEAEQACASEVRRQAEEAEMAAAGVDRLNAAFAKIQAMHESGALEPAEI